MADPFLGEIRAFAFNYNTPGWQLCNGASLPVNEYQALYAIIGTQFGGNGMTSFNLPDLCGRMIVGAGASTNPTHPTPVSNGQVGGSNTVTLTALNIAAHSHPATVADPGHVHSVSVPAHTHSFAVPCDDGTNGPQTPSPVGAYPTPGTGVDANFATLTSEVNAIGSGSGAGPFNNPPATLLYAKAGSASMAAGTTGNPSGAPTGASGANKTGITVAIGNNVGGTPVTVTPPFLGVGYFICTSNGIFPPRD